MRPSTPGPQGVLARLESRGHRLTSPRRAVLRALALLMASNGLFSAEEVCRALPQVGRATVYRTMRLLAGEGIVCRVRLEDGTMRYRLSYLGHHHHLVCVRCGQVQDFVDHDLGSAVEGAVREFRFQVEGHWLEVYGRCRTCRESAA